MTVAPDPTPTPRTPTPPTPARPDLRLVPADHDGPPQPADTAEPEPIEPVEVADGAVETTDPVAGGDGRAARPQAPLDVRLLHSLGEVLAARPRWAQRPPSLAEAWEYSMRGDWTTEDKSAKRLAHGLCVALALLGTYPLDWAVQTARRTPGGFLLGLALLFVLYKTL